VTSINDTNGNEIFGITATASAVNELTIANAATGNNPVVSATGSDTNIGITLTPKGTGNAVLTSGNLAVANGNGIDFSATPGTGTSELLADYEEGLWTPTQGTGLVVTGTFGSAGSYTKVGRIVTISFKLTATTSMTALNVANIAGGLPFAVFNDTIGSFGVLTNAAVDVIHISQISGSSIFLEGGTSLAATTVVFGSATYQAAA
jgi:hypothetical protein